MRVAERDLEIAPSLGEKNDEMQRMSHSASTIVLELFIRVLIGHSSLPSEGYLSNDVLVYSDHVPWMERRNCYL